MGQMGALRTYWTALGTSRLRLAPARERLGRSLTFPLTALVLCLSGCIPGPFLRPDDSTTSHCDSPSADETNPDPSSNSADQQPEKNRKPSPRTLPQAMRAYWHCLCTHGAETNDNVEEKKKTSKDDSSNGTSPDKDKEEKDKGAKEGGSSEEKKENGNSSEEKKNGKEEEAKESWFSAHAQATMVTQTHDVFPSPYIGPKSLLPVEPSPTSLTATLFLDARLWKSDEWSGELVFNPELAGGRGFSGVLGLAGFPNGENQKVGEVQPTPYFARLFLRQTWGFGGEQEKVEDEPNQIAGTRDVDRVTVIVGKLSPTDLMDDNRYSHDPRLQYLNWALMYNGAWDYPANVRGYSYGIGIDFNQKNWAFRYSIFAEPSFAQGAPLDPKFLKANGQVIELEERYAVNDHNGRLRLLGYLNRAHMGDYREALEQMPVDPDITATRAYRFKYGFGANLEQEITKDLGMFMRLGWDDGHTESWAFTEIDRTAAMGFVLNGRCWCRKQDQVGLAGVINGLSGDHRNYLGAGGVGFQIGDGQLRYGPEEILETFYNYAIVKGVNVTFDFQEVNHPAYNRDRGPVSIYTLRVHIEL